MSGLITQGYGSKNLIVTLGLGRWERIKKIVREIIERVVYVPKKRVPFKEKIKVIGEPSFPTKEKVPVVGDLVQKFREVVPVKGKKDRSEIMKIILEDEDEEDEDLSDLEEQKKILDRREKTVRLAAKILEIDRLMKELEEAEASEDLERMKEITKRFEELVKDEE